MKRALITLTLAWLGASCSLSLDFVAGIPCHKAQDCLSENYRCVDSQCVPDDGSGYCGDGVTDWDEECDDGEANGFGGCTSSCSLIMCGYSYDEPAGTELHCGDCGHACGMGSCEKGECKAHLVGPLQVGTPRAIQVQGDYVYWLEMGDEGASNGLLGRFRTSGDGWEVVLDELSNPYGLAVDPTHAYWITDRTLERCSIDGGAHEVIFSNLARPTAIDQVGDYVYWLQAATDANDDRPAVLFYEKPTNKGFLITRHPESYGTSLALTYDGIYYTEEALGQVSRFPYANEPVHPVATDQPGPFKITYDENAVYWVNVGTEDENFTNGEVRKFSYGGWGSEILAWASSPVAIATDGDDVYWLDDDGLWSISVHGYDRRLLSTQGGVDLSLSDTAVFWISEKGLFRANKDVTAFPE